MTSPLILPYLTVTNVPSLTGFHCNFYCPRRGVIKFKCMHTETELHYIAIPTQGVSNGHKNFQVLAKFDLCSICSQNLEECSLAHACKIFATARVLGFSLEFLLHCSKFCKSCNVRIGHMCVMSQNIELSSFGSGYEIIAKLRY